ncbi:unnamed protein product [Sphagnum tenellum]
MGIVCAASGFVKWDVTQSILCGLNSCGGLAITSSFSRGSISFLPACLPACRPSVVYCSSAMTRAALWSPRPGTNVSHFSGRLWCL